MNQPRIKGLTGAREHFWMCLGLTAFLEKGLNNNVIVSVKDCILPSLALVGGVQSRRQKVCAPYNNLGGYCFPLPYLSRG